MLIGKAVALTEAIPSAHTCIKVNMIGIKLVKMCLTVGFIKTAVNVECIVSCGKVNIGVACRTDATNLTFTVADTSVCTVDAFGLITAPNLASAAGKTTTLTISNGTLTVTINVKIAR